MLSHESRFVLKMSSFSVIPKKIPFPNSREKEVTKRKKEEYETDRLYQDILESFNADEDPSAKSFVRGGVINPNERWESGMSWSKQEESNSSKKSKYAPSFKPSGLAAKVHKGKDADREGRDQQKSKETQKTRNIDIIMEEIKLQQEQRKKQSEERDHRRKAKTNRPSRFDVLPADTKGSPEYDSQRTANLYVGNLAPKVDENFLLRTFGRFGPILCVKIMWPRTEQERRRQRKCGFVAFMNRVDAQAAMDKREDIFINHEIKISWGKSLPFPYEEFPAALAGQMTGMSQEASTPNTPDIEVVPPDDKHLCHVIDTMAMYVLEDGCAFEQVIMEQTQGNPLFGFLFDLQSTEHTYYVWRLYSLTQGDTLQRWRTEPFIMICGSGRWIPPPMSLHTSRNYLERDDYNSANCISSSRKMDLERSLTEGQRDEFEKMLRSLTVERSRIKEAMCFALDNAAAAREVVEVLSESLTIKETPLLTKVARLMLVSDILHNSNVPVRNAFAYRTEFEMTLPDVMESFNDVYRSITNSATVEALKERVLKVLQVWSDWSLFSDVYLNGLRATFLRAGNLGAYSFDSVHRGTSQGRQIDDSNDENTVPPQPRRFQEFPLASEKRTSLRKLSSLPVEELRRQCIYNGLSIRGGREMMVARLLSLQEAD